MTYNTAELMVNIRSRRWRMSNLYWIIDDDGRRVKFVPNPAQQQLLDEKHTFNIILKSRQLGFSTFIQLLMLDACLFNSNTDGGVIAHTVKDAKKIYRTKFKYPYNNLPAVIRERIPMLTDTMEETRFANNSSISVGTSMRSGTLQWLHISEYGKICARMPDKATEIRTGALNTVSAGNMIFIESTAEGREGHFFELCQTAQAKALSGAPLSPLDFKFHFFAWWMDDRNKLTDADMPEGMTIEDIDIPNELTEYFASVEPKVEDVFGLDLFEFTLEQKAWYYKKWETQGDEMKREHPSLPEEAFEQAIEGAFFAKQFAVARKQKRIETLPVSSIAPTFTFWDIGMSDAMTIWVMQLNGQWRDHVFYYENSGEALPHYINVLNEWASQNDVVFKGHFVPHDATKRDSVHKDTFFDGMNRMIAGEVHLVPRVKDKQLAIQKGREVLKLCRFDPVSCDRGLKCLEHYRKEWNEKLGVWRNEPRHDWASHGADSFLTEATGFDPSKYNDDDFNRKLKYTNKGVV